MRKVLIGLVASSLVTGGAAGYLAAQPANVAGSSFGVYPAYAHPKYDGYSRSSQYVSARDGTKLAVDVYRPTLKGKLADGSLPVVWTFTPYNRALRGADGRISPTEDTQISLVAYGYVVAIADVRGKGASFGVRNGPADAHETNDAYDITEWLAAQPWSSGKVGMMGCSYFGATALQGVRSGAPHLKAAFVGTTMFDQYGTFAQGGITSSGLLDDSVSASEVSEVDSDKDRREVARALAEHAANTPTGKFFASTPYRDDINPFTKTQWWQAGSFYPYLDKIRPDVGIYVYGGYHDVYSDQTILEYQNIRANKKLAFGDWFHCESPGFHMDTERLRFFDYWLKGVDNGVMSEKPVSVYVSRAEDGTEWRSLASWPQSKSHRFYLSSVPAVDHASRGEQASLVDGQLQQDQPAVSAAATVIDHVPEPQPLVVYGAVRASVDPYSATFTLPPQQDLKEYIGSPVVHLWVSSSSRDADLYVYLEHVNRMGGAQVIARGALRASHRKLGMAPYNTDGLPWQTNLRKDAQPLSPGTPVSIDLALSPTAYTFRDGDQVRLAITTRAPDEETSSSVPVVKVISDAKHPSWVDLPETDTRADAIAPDPVVGTTFPAYRF